jgi:hypothetical protein
MELWTVMQDGQSFYVTLGGQDEPEVYEYPGKKIEDGHMDAAREARAWFVENILPGEAAIEWI